MQFCKKTLACSLFTLTAVSSPLFAQGQTKVKLLRPYHAGTSIRYKDVGKIIAPFGEITITTTTKLTVKDMKGGIAVISLEEEGGQMSMGDNGDRDIPKGPLTTETRNSLGKLFGYNRPAPTQQGSGQQSPEMSKLGAILSEPVLTDKEVSAGDSWMSEFENPAIKNTKFTVKTIFIGTEKIDGVSYYKLTQKGEAVANAKGETMAVELTAWLNPVTGLLFKRESTTANPSPFGRMELKATRTILGNDQNEAKYRAMLKSTETPAGGMWLEKLDVSKMTSGWEGHDPQIGKSIEGAPLTLKGTVFPHGIGTHAPSEWTIDLKGIAIRFLSMVGVDDEKIGSEGSVSFEVVVDGKKVATSEMMRGGDEPKFLNVDLTGAKKLVLRVTDAGDGESSDHADWGGSVLLLVPGRATKPVAIPAPVLKVDPARYIPVATDPKPAIHGPKITGASPGKPFQFMIPATGTAPLSYSAQGLPEGLTLNAKTGIITGKLQKSGTTEVTLTVKNALGSSLRKLSIVSGDHKLSLTPPMGWNSWNSWAGAIDADKVRTSADVMIKSGLAAHGFNFINIDDTWEGMRDASGEIQTNKKFPDMTGLCDYVHNQGLKFGIYSSPGATTCAGFVASLNFEDQDAASYAKWGVDYLKYDWCSYGAVATGVDEKDKQMKPYQKMRLALDKADRDIVYSLCQYGSANVWEWGADKSVLGNCWRTTGDITDTWSSLKNIYQAQAGHEKYAGPGHWNDPDMLIVGRVGWGNPHPTRLPPNAQLLHISMWAMIASPMLIGCDMGKLDDFTLQILTNDEILDISQDSLGKAAGRVAKQGDLEVWSRLLSDGTTAVCLVNASDEEAPITANWTDIGVTGKQRVRDLWLHKNLGEMANSYTEKVPARGCIVVKVGTPK